MNLRKAALIHDNEYNGKFRQECPRLRRDGPKRKRRRDVIDEQQKARLEELSMPLEKNKMAIRQSQNLLHTKTTDSACRNLRNITVY